MFSMYVLHLQVAVNARFAGRLGEILQICVPSVFSKEALFILVQSCLLVNRTLLTGFDSSLPEQHSAASKDSGNSLSFRMWRDLSANLVQLILNPSFDLESLVLVDIWLKTCNPSWIAVGAVLLSADRISVLEGISAEAVITKVRSLQFIIHDFRRLPINNYWLQEELGEHDFSTMCKSSWSVGYKSQSFANLKLGWL